MAGGRRPPPLARWGGQLLLGAAVLGAAWLCACTAGPLDAIALGSNSLADGLLAHYTFDEGGGSTVVDHSGNDRDGALTGGDNS